MTKPDGMSAWREAARIIEANSDNQDLFAENMNTLFNGDTGVPAGLFLLTAELTNQPDAATNPLDALGHMGITAFIAGMLWERDRTAA